MDGLHGTLSGPATRKLCERAWQVFGDARFERLAGISNGHLYNLRRSRPYELRMGAQAATRRAQVAIGERRRPRPGGRPGWVRVDSVHQGDMDKVKGVYHINAVDTVTQYQFAGSAERIAEWFLPPVLEGLLESFPLRVRGFHSDNGSEYVNYRVAELWEKLRIEEFTKSRPRRSNDNAWVAYYACTVLSALRSPAPRIPIESSSILGENHHDTDPFRPEFTSAGEAGVRSASLRPGDLDGASSPGGS